ncbi:hypothetical protein JHK85_010377 [Glycine max]|nr:hypothetical protein JHK85_010377 [Glycine max]
MDTTTLNLERADEARVLVIGVGALDTSESDKKNNGNNIKLKPNLPFYARERTETQTMTQRKPNPYLPTSNSQGILNKSFFFLSRFCYAQKAHGIVYTMVHSSPIRVWHIVLSFIDVSLDEFTRTCEACMILKEKSPSYVLRLRQGLGKKLLFSRTFRSWKKTERSLKGYEGA